MLKTFVRFLIVLGALMLTVTAGADIPMLDNQPEATDVCPIVNTAHTESNGTIGVRNYGCNYDGHNVVWSVSIPEGCEDGGCGLIIDNHGATMNANVENNGTKLREYGWKAEDYGASTPYIVAQPSLTDLIDPNDGYLDIDSVMGGAYDNEIPGMKMFILDLIDSFNVDTNRIHAYGFSRGSSTILRYYCDPSFRDIFASFAAGGGGAFLNCAFGLDKPFFVINGNTDPNISTNDDNAAAMVDLGATRLVVSGDSGWWLPKIRFTWTGPQMVGQHIHERYITDDIVYDSIKHSGAVAPLAGHCHPIKTTPCWLSCRTTIETGEKLIRFFIANPK